MITIWLISDTHFSHTNIIEYCNRPFASVEEMDETMVDRWNRIVRREDHVWHLGDVAMARRALQIVKRLNGHKRLVFGNHDIFTLKDYVSAGFEKLTGVRVFHQLTPRVICSHFPLHPASVGGNINVHGHVHNNIPGLGPQYVNVSVEVTDYRPITLEEAVARASHSPQATHAPVAQLGIPSHEVVPY